jgi:hypothetical protein
VAVQEAAAAREEAWATRDDVGALASRLDAMEAAQKPQEVTPEDKGPAAPERKAAAPAAPSPEGDGDGGKSEKKKKRGWWSE